MRSRMRHLGVGTVTALSNNATVFSYPHFDLPVDHLSDISWAEVAEVALSQHAGQAIEVPTGHGFRMLMTRDMLDAVGRLDEIYGRGYGEENDLCSRAADLGFRHLAAAGVFVQHREGVSFGMTSSSLKRANAKILSKRFAEFNYKLAEFTRRDPLRCARWTLDRIRLRKADVEFVLIVYS
jgi:GT2 family glycosyltransferase